MSSIGGFRESGEEFGRGQNHDRGTSEVAGVAGDDGVEAAFDGAGNLQIILEVGTGERCRQFEIARWARAKSACFRTT